MIHKHVIILKSDLLIIADSARVDDFVKLECGMGMTIGECVHIATFCHLGIGGGKLVIGDHAGVASGAKIITGSNQMTGLSMSASSPAKMQIVKRGIVIIEPFAFIGVGAIIMPDVVIGKGAVVGAGAVVTKSIDPWTVVAGTPARVIGQRKLSPELIAMAYEN